MMLNGIGRGYRKENEKLGMFSLGFFIASVRRMQDGASWSALASPLCTSGHKMTELILGLQ